MILKVIILLLFIAEFQSVEKNNIHIVVVGPEKYLFVFPDSNQRIIQLKYLDKNYTKEQMSISDSFIFTNTNDLELCGRYQFVVYDKYRTAVQFKSEGRRCCN